MDDVSTAILQSGSVRLASPWITCFPGHAEAREPDNLALACRRCNERHYNFTTGRDPLTHQERPLFHPVQDVWAEHFAWTPEGQWIVAKTPIGRSTVERLDLNDERHDDGFIRISRALWVQGGWHPSSSDPVLPGDTE
jgi:hypothetical protein